MADLGDLDQESSGWGAKVLFNIKATSKQGNARFYRDVRPMVFGPTAFYAIFIYGGLKEQDEPAMRLYLFLVFMLWMGGILVVVSGLDSPQ